MSLIKLIGESIPKKQSFLGKLIFVTNVIYFDGPLLSLYKNSFNDNFLVAWVDGDQKRNRWMTIKVSTCDLYAYINKKISLKSIYGKANEFVFFHTSSSSKQTSIYKVLAENFPKKYYPSEDSFFDDEIISEEFINLFSENLIDYELRLDSNKWYLNDFENVTKLFRAIYCFYYHLAQMKNFELVVRNYQWQEGVNANSMFGRLRRLIPPAHQLKVKEIQYASPGHIKLQVLGSVTEIMRNSLRNICVLDKQLESKAWYVEARSFLKKQGEIVNAKLPQEEDRENNVNASVHNLALGEIDVFLSLYRLELSRELHDYLKNSQKFALGFLKAVLSFHRRVMALSQYVERGMLKI